MDDEERWGRNGLNRFPGAEVNMSFVVLLALFMQRHHADMSSSQELERFDQSCLAALRDGMVDQCRKMPQTCSLCVYMTESEEWMGKSDSLG